MAIFQRCISSWSTASRNSTKSWGQALPAATFQLLAKADFSPALETLVAQVLEQIYRQGVIARQALPLPKPQELILRTLSSKKESTVQAPFPFPGD